MTCYFGVWGSIWLVDCFSLFFEWFVLFFWEGSAQTTENSQFCLTLLRAEIIVIHYYTQVKYVIKSN